MTDTETKNIENIERVTHLRIIKMENFTCPDRRSIGATWELGSLADVAIALDLAEQRSIEKHGGSGHGAGAFLEATFGEEDPNDYSTPGEQVTSVDDVVFDGLPLMGPGTLKRLRAFITDARNSTIWDGNNHVQCPSNHSCELLARIRRVQAATIMGCAKSEAKTAAARKNAPLGGAKGGRPPGTTIRVKGQLIEVVKKIHGGLRITHNVDGRYNLVWAITADGKIYRTYGRRGGTWREARPDEQAPAELLGPCTITVQGGPQAQDPQK